MSKKIQIKITNVRSMDDKKIERYLKDKFPDQYRNFYTQKDKRNNLSVHYSIKYNITLCNEMRTFFREAGWSFHSE